MDKKMRVLAVGAHPDDIEIRCGGTLARYAEMGHHVMMGYATNGNKGHRTIPPDELAQIREKESRAAAAVIGAEVFWLNFPDAELFYDKETRLAFVDMIRQARPDLIITHWREAYHPDHMATSELVCGASYISTVPHVKTDHPPCAAVPMIYYFEVDFTVESAAAEYVDVSAVYEKKRQMLACHASQFEWLRENHGVDLAERMIPRDRSYGAQCGVAYAERFVPRGFRPKERLLP
ncbi:MAG: PIG-L family deacetylase [Anaerolineae bacterium]|nr:PIG-L family deacetylase [Anaerolineae bacterium]